jgi:phosphoribosylformimino-5-aminoimidazole carboxamide ribotide isomerase
MQVIPSIDLEGGRSRLVSWPGAATGSGVPTDRPEQIAARFVDQGARIINLVDFDGARAGQPRNLEAVARIAARVAVPLQLAGGLEDGDAIRLAFAAGATRAVVSLAVADEPSRLRDCLAAAGDWLAVGLDPRPERLAGFPWHRPVPPTLDALVGELVGAGVRRFVLSHGGSEPDLDRLRELRRAFDVDLLIAGGVTDIATIARLRDAGVAGVILGEPLLTGTLDLPTVLETAA